jgi:hypothetical protein
VRRTVAVALALMCLAAVHHAGTARASYGVLDSFGQPNGPGAQLGSSVTAVAVNRSGAGGAAVGDVYVVDYGNNRVDQFDQEGSFIRAFGWDVVASGPDDVTPASAVQSVDVPASVSGGTFSLSFNGITTAPIAFDASAEEVKAALATLSSIPKAFSNPASPAVEVTGGPGATAPYSVHFVHELAHMPVSLITADSSNLTGGSVAVSMTTAGVSNYEVCDLAAHPTDVCQAAKTNFENSPVPGLGAMFGPSGIAIDQATGAVYVADGGYDRIDVYSAGGAPEGAFAWGVVNGARELQFCTETCLGGVEGKLDPLHYGRRIEGGGAGQFDGGISGLDIDPDGRLYVADNGNHRVDEFAPQLSGGAVSGVSFLRAYGWDVVESGPDDVPDATARQLLTIPSSVSGGKFTLSFEGATTGELPYNAGQNTLFLALNGLTPVKEAQGRIEVLSKGPGKWELVFENQLENVPVPPISVDSGKLIGGEASISVLSQGASRFEVCDVAAHPSEVCKAGLEGSHEGQFSVLADLAVDAAGEVFAVDAGVFRNSGSNTGICTVESKCRVEEFSSAPAPQGDFAPAQLSAQSGEEFASQIAIDPADGRLFVAKGTLTYYEHPGSTRILEFTPAGGFLGSSPPGGGIVGRLSDFAVGSGESLYVGRNTSENNTPSAEVLILGPAPAPAATIGAVTDIGARSATFHGTVTPPAPGPLGGYQTFYRFEYSRDGSTWTKAPAEGDLEAGDGTGSGSPESCPVEDPPSCNVSLTVEGLEPNATYQVRLVATTGTDTTTSPVQFTTASAPPSVSDVAPEAVGREAATLSAFVNPNNEETSYRFEWGTTTAYGNEAPVAGASAGAAGQEVKVAAPIAGLEENTVYHFRILATNGAGTTTSADHELRTLNSAGLPDNRRPELVSAADKRPQGRVGSVLAAQLTFQAAADGEAFAYPVRNGLLDSTAGGELRYLAGRTAGGWESSQLSAPALVPPPSVLIPSTLKYLSPDLSCGLLATYEPLTADTPAVDLESGVTNLYRINPDGTHTLVSNTVPSNPTISLGGPSSSYDIFGASADCSRVYFATLYKLLPNASGFYEWRDGVLHDAGRLPDGAAAAVVEASVVGAQWAAINAVSPDGSRAFFSAKSDAGSDSGERAVFMREGGSTTIDVSQSETATAPTGARYQMASPDGSDVFFTANYGLTADSSSGPSAGCASAGAGACDLYDYDTEAHTLTDLSADANPADSEGAAVLGVLGVSKDGSTAYFAARGQLLAGKGNTYQQNTAGAGSANVYRAHGGALSFVGTVKGRDLENGVLAQVSSGYATWSSKVTPDGSHLLFVSSAKVSGYDSGGFREAYLYSAETQSTLCVSCRRDGQPSLGEPSPIGVIASNRGGQSEENYYPRSLSDDASQAFFTSRDPLAPGAASGNGAEGIYEWRNGQVSLLASESGGTGTKIAYLDASADGRDVFILTAKQLDPHDTDFSYDAYDLRAGGGFPPPAEPPLPCVPAEDQCQGPASPPPPASSPASSGFVGAGNPARPKPCARGRVRRQGRCVRRHRKHHKRHHRHTAGHDRGRSR